MLHFVQKFQKRAFITSVVSEKDLILSKLLQPISKQDL